MDPSLGVSGPAAPGSGSPVQAPGADPAAVLRGRYDQVFRAMLSLALLAYGSYGLLFAALGVPRMPLVNAAAFGVVLLSTWALRRGRRRLALALIGSVVLGHIVPSTQLLGWDASFHVFAYLFLIFLMLEPELGLRWKLVAVVLLTVWYLGLEAVWHVQPTLVSESTQAIFKRLNLVMFWGSLAYLALIYASAMWESTGRLQVANAQLANAEQSLRELFQHSPVAMVLSHVADQTLADANRRAEQLFEAPLQQVKGQPIQDFWARPEDRAAFRERILKEGRAEGFEAELKTRSGRTFWAELSGSLVQHGRGQALLVSASDISERRHLAALMRESEQTLRTLLDASPTPLVVTGLADGVIRYGNQRAAELFELPIEQLVGKRAPDFYVNPADRTAFVEELRREGRVQAFTTRLRSSSGREHWMVLTARTLELKGERLFMVGFADVSAHKELEARLRELASTDGLTGAANRRHFFEVGEAELQRAARYGHATAVALLDADHFKRINDELGHQAGDRALKLLVEVVREQVRGSDTLARYGGEEFALLLPETPVEVAAQVVERIRASIEARSFETDGRACRFTVSAGLCAARPGERLEAALHRADEALYAAKQAGRNRVVTAAS